MEERNINILLRFCFNELPQQEQEKVEQLIIEDDFYFEVVAGLARLKRFLGTKEKVQEYLDQRREEAKKVLFPVD